MSISKLSKCLKKKNNKVMQKQNYAHYRETQAESEMMSIYMNMVI